MSRLDEIKARADAATDGPWVRDMHSPDMSGRSGPAVPMTTPTERTTR